MAAFRRERTPYPGKEPERSGRTSRVRTSPRYAPTLSVHPFDHPSPYAQPLAGRDEVDANSSLRAADGSP